MNQAERRQGLPVGAEALREGGVEFRVWAPRRQRVEVVFEDNGTAPLPLTPEGNGYFSGRAAGAGPGALYRYRLDGDKSYPDPASRFQPQGVHGPSQVIDPHGYSWRDRGWKGVSLPGQVLYEMHIGTFTPEGTWAAAQRELPELARLGITVLEIMPVAEFPGRFGWGYDGVAVFAPTRLYGQPDDMRRFVDEAHALGLGVILDVVYNHLGPDGCYFREFSKTYFSDRHTTEWGDALNYDGPDNGPVRELFLANAVYWIEEFHLDGLRLDATQSIFDDSPRHFLAELVERTRDAAHQQGREILLIGENEPQHPRLVRRPEEGGYGLDALWNDDYHHTARVAMTGRTEAYYRDYQGTPQEFISAFKYGYLYQGQRYDWQNKRRGKPAFGVPPAAFVTFIQNHDQVANSARGLRCHQLTSASRYRAMTAMTLLAPGTPMLFMGQEFASSSPFLYFADHNPELAPLVRKGRAEFLAQFPSIAPPEVRDHLADPGDEKTFLACKLDFSERQKHEPAYALHADLLKLRREDPVLAAQRPGGVDGAVLGPEAFVIRYFGGDGDDRLLLVNLGHDLKPCVVPEPLLAPPEGRRWQFSWSSESPRYGGGASPIIEADEGCWSIPAEAAVVLRASFGGDHG